MEISQLSKSNRYDQTIAGKLAQANKSLKIGDKITFVSVARGKDMFTDAICESEPFQKTFKISGKKCLLDVVTAYDGKYRYDIQLHNLIKR